MFFASRKTDVPIFFLYYPLAEFNKLPKENFDERLKQANLGCKSYIADLKKTDFDKKLCKINNKVTSNKTTHAEAEKKLNNQITCSTKLINDLSREVKLTSTKRLTKDLINGHSILNKEKYFAENGSQNYLVFQPVSKYFQTFTGDTDKILAWKSKGLSEESIKTSVTSGKSFVSKLTFVYNKIGTKFKGNC